MMRNPALNDNLPPVTLASDAICGTDDRVLVAAALVMLAMLTAAAYGVWRWVTPLWGVR